MTSIQIVDDDAPSREFVSKFLELKGYQVRGAGSSEEAFELISQQWPELILMDILLPGMDGIEAAVKLKNEPGTSQIKVIATTAMAMKGDEAKISQGGFEAYLVKPLDISTLLMTIQRCLCSEGTISTPARRTFELPGPMGFDEFPESGAIPPNIRVYIVEDESLIRESLSAMLDLEEDIELVGGAGNAEQASEDLKSLKEDVVLMDLRLPGMDGIEAMRILKQEHTSLGMVAVTAYKEQYFEGAIEAGAVGYILKSGTPQQLVQAIRLAVQKLGTLDPSLTATLMRSFSELSTKQRASLLTPRQIEVIKMVANGSRYQEIARELSVNESTVSREMRRILERLEARDPAHAVSEAYKRRLL